MIDKLRVKNFKAIKSLEVELSPLTVLVGPNGSGKTSILEAIDEILQLTAATKISVDFVEHKLGILHRWGTDAALELIAEREYEAVRLTAEPKSWEEATHKATEWLVGLEARSATHEDWQPVESQLDVAQVYLTRTLGTPGLLRLDARQLAAPAETNGQVPRMSSDGFGLASLLAHMKLQKEYQATFESIKDSLRAIVPSFVDLDFTRVEISKSEVQTVSIGEQHTAVPVHQKVWGYGLVFDTTSGQRLPASQMSEGTLIVLGLLAVIMGPNPPNVILLDDIDRALHPAAQGALIEVLRKLLRRSANLQIIATSHSPYLLDHLQPEEVRLTRLDDSGCVVCAKLSEHPDFPKWKDAMTPGELWSVMGENWIGSANPSETAP